MPYANRTERTRPAGARAATAGEQMTEQAVALATQGRWAEAVEVNRALLKRQPNDTQTLNRLGKCMSELGRYEAATAFYKQALVHDQQNEIARKNLDRLTLLEASPATAGAEHAMAAPRAFIVDAGRSTVTALRGTADPEALAACAPGAELELRAEGGGLHLYDRQGRPLGALAPKLAQRLLALMQAGNTYAAALTSTAQGKVSVMLRETYRHPSQAHTNSFAPPEESQVVRGHTRDKLLRVVDEDGEDLDEDGDEEEDDGTSTLTVTDGDYPDAERSDAEERDPFVNETPRVPDEG